MVWHSIPSRFPVAVPELAPVLKCLLLLRCNLISSQWRNCGATGDSRFEGKEREILRTEREWFTLDISANADGVEVHGDDVAVGHVDV